MNIVVRFKAAAGHEAVVKRLAKIQNMPITANQLRHPDKQTNAPIGARKCNFPAFVVYYGRQTNQQTDIRVHREVTLPIISCLTMPQDKNRETLTP